MADHLPLIVFPNASVIPPEKGKGFPVSQPSFPSHANQVGRLSGQIDSLKRDFQEYAANVSGAVAGLEPETVLVIEIAGSVDDFKQAIESAGMEWLGEWDIDDIEPTDDFYQLNSKGERVDKPVTGRMFLSMTSQTSLEELLSLWEKWEKNQKLPTGKTKWRDVFNQLLTIRRWGIEETLIETGMIDRWEDYLNPIDPDEKISFQIELFYRRNSQVRSRIESAITELLGELGGRTLSSFVNYPEISFHAVKAELPASSIKSILENIDNNEKRSDEIQLITFPGIMYFRPTGQSLAPAEDDEGVPFDFPDIPSEEAPVAALIDGFPLLQHEALKDRVLIDDIFELERHYQPGDRKHGTSMASLILYGDMSSEDSEPLARKLYCIPIMQPDPKTQNRSEHIPEDTFFEDRLHIAIKHLVEGSENSQPTGIRLINLSMGDPERPFIHTPSPWARLLDWLSWKYRILFCVSAGNCMEPIDLGVNHNDFRVQADDERISSFLKAASQNLSSRRLISPAESLNSLTIGALHADDFGEYPANGREDILPSNEIFSPISRLGYGFRKSLKPEIFLPGGRQLYSPPMLDRDTIYQINKVTALGPGQRVASDGSKQGELSSTAFTKGSSNAAALATRAGINIYDMLVRLREDENEEIPDDLICVVIKALLVHGARHPENAKKSLVESLKNNSNSRRIKEVISRYTGYGTPDITRVLECTSQRATVIGCGEIREDEIHEYKFPLPADLSGEKLWRHLIITLAWLSPINPDHRNLREAKLNIESGGDNWGKSPLKVKRQDSDHNQVLRGTVQHEVLEGNDQISAFQEGDSLVLRVICKKDATIRLDESIPYGLAVTLEVKEDTQINIYQQIKAAIKPQVPVGSNP
ncbi:S8 family peptidase [Marinobacter salarius]